MSQQNIDFGTFPDDPSADAIRTAFQKVQENFNEIYGSTLDAAVLSVNQTAGRGITVNTPTGNVIVTANISSITVSSLSMKVGVTPNPVSNTAVYTNFNQTLYVELPSNVSITNLNVSGNITAGGNLTASNAQFGNNAIASFFIGDGSLLTNVDADTANYSNFAGIVIQNNQPNITSLGTLTSLDVSGNIIVGNTYANTGIIQAQYLKGDGSNITGVSTTGANVTGQVANALVASTVYTNAQPNITSTGTLASLSVSGNSNIGNIGTGIITATGNITGGNLATVGNLNIGGNTILADLSVSGIANLGSVSNVKITGGTGILQSDGAGNLSFVTVITQSIPGAANTVLLSDGANLISASGNIKFNDPQLAITGTLSVSGNASVGNISATNVTGTLTTGSQPNITSVGTLTSLALGGTLNSNSSIVLNNINANITTLGNISAQGNTTGGNLTTGGNVTATGNIDGGNLNASGNVSAIGNITGSNIIGTLLTGTLTTQSQPNITSTGTLTSLSVSGQITNANITTGANTTAGSLTGNWTLTTGSRLQATYADLAEYYAGSEQIESGTVVEFGGEQEVQICNIYMSKLVAGIVTTDPAYVMNSGIKCEYPIAIALQGRIPAKVIGPVKRGDMMVSANNGHAISCKSPSMGTVLGKALTDFNGDVGIIEIMVGRT
jgi:hypothetical protein